MAQAYKDPVESFLEIPEQRNWVSVGICLKVTTDALAHYVYCGMENIYSKISKECAKLPSCTEKCSKTKEHANMWCQTCKAWRNGVLKYCRRRKHREQVRWKFISVSKWSLDCPENVEDLARVFVHNLRSEKETVTDELSSLLAIVENCIFFDDSFIKSRVVYAMRDSRNEFAHSNCRLSSEQMHASFNACVQLLAHPRLSGYNKTTSAANVVSQLQAGHLQCVLRDYSIELNKDRTGVVSDIVIRLCEDSRYDEHKTAPDTNKTLFTSGVYDIRQQVQYKLELNL